MVIFVVGSEGVIIWIKCNIEKINYLWIGGNLNPSDLNALIILYENLSIISIKSDLISIQYSA